MMTEVRKNIPVLLARPPAEGAAGDSSGGQQRDGDDDTFVLAGVTPRGLDDK